MVERLVATPSWWPDQALTALAKGIERPGVKASEWPSTSSTHRAAEPDRPGDWGAGLIRASASLPLILGAG